MHDFKLFLVRQSKREHVADGLIASVQRFAAFLAERGRGLSTATTDDLDAFITATERIKAGSASKAIRGIALYYGWTGRTDLAAHAGAYRAQKVAQGRRAAPLREFRGVDPGDLARLSARGIVTAEDLITAGSTPAKRAALAVETGVDLPHIVELMKLADLSRLAGLKAVRARLYVDAGMDTLDKLAAADPVELRRMFVDYVARTGFDGIAPLPKELEHTVESARTLERRVQWE